MTLMTGGSPRTMGVNYDVAYDRALNPPFNDTGNGLLGTGPCTPGPPSGTSTEYDEGININVPGIMSQMFLNGGAPTGDGGINSIDRTRLERDENCTPVFPWNFVRVNTIYGVIHGAGGYTAWSDKHPSYSSVGGPTGNDKDTNVDDYFGPEINSDSADYTNPETGAFPGLIPGSTLVPPSGCNPLPDQAAVSAADDYTGSFQNIQCYDGIKVNAILNEIDGRNHFLQPILAARGQKQSGAGLCKALCAGGSDAGAAAGNKNNFAAKRKVSRGFFGSRGHASPGNFIFLKLVPPYGIVQQPNPSCPGREEWPH